VEMLSPIVSVGRKPACSRVCSRIGGHAVQRLPTQVLAAASTGSSAAGTSEDESTALEEAAIAAAMEHAEACRAPAACLPCVGRCVAAFGLKNGSARVLKLRGRPGQEEQPAAAEPDHPRTPKPVALKRRADAVTSPAPTLRPLPRRKGVAAEAAVELPPRPQPASPGPSECPGTQPPALPAVPALQLLGGSMLATPLQAAEPASHEAILRPNSSTHRAEWMAFMRLMANKSKVTPAMSEEPHPGRDETSRLSQACCLHGLPRAMAALPALPDVA
jgi:hypothetical protein